MYTIYKIHIFQHIHTCPAQQTAVIVIVAWLYAVRLTLPQCEWATCFSHVLLLLHIIIIQFFDSLKQRTCMFNVVTVAAYNLFWAKIQHHTTYCCKNTYFNCCESLFHYSNAWTSSVLFISLFDHLKWLRIYYI